MISGRDNYTAVQRNIVARVSPVTLECDSSGIPAPTARWFFNGDTVFTSPGVRVQGNNVDILSPVVSNSGIYQCMATNVAGETQRVWTLEINEQSRCK